MKPKPASEEIVKSLYQKMGQNFKLLTPMLNGSVERLKEIEQIDKSLLSADLLNINQFWERLLKIHIYSLLVNLDISAALRAGMQSKSNIERRTNIKYINVLTLEGYKYLFPNKRDKDDQLNSVWSKFMDAVKALNCDELTSDFSEMEIAAVQFASNYVRKIDVTNRNLAIHYDNNPFKVCKYLESIENEDLEYKRAISFMAITESIFKYIEK